MSGYIIQHKAEYYEKLLQVTTHGAWIEWVLYFLHAVEETSKWTTDKIFAIQELIGKSRAFIKANAASIYSKELVDLLFVQPYVRIPNLIESGIAKRDAASKYLKILSEIGILHELKRGRDKLFINHKFLDLFKQK